MRYSRAAVLSSFTACALLAVVPAAGAEVIGFVPAAAAGQYVAVSGNGRFVAGTETAGGVCGPDPPNRPGLGSVRVRRPEQRNWSAPV